MSAVLLLVLKACVGLLILAIGLGATIADLGYLWRRPALLARSLLAMYVLVPAAAFLLVAFLPLSVGLKAALLVLAVSAGAPLLPRKLGSFGNGAYTFSLVVTSSLLAIGHLLGGPADDDRTTLAIACATRHVGIAVLVATSFPGPRTAVLIGAYLVASAAVSLPYLRWRRTAAARAKAPAG